ncbi:porin family protein [Mesonia aestuariivivens]|uniref:PorT family protein n=1 Tax=Mesonia aestuariivivens TaxID=2796128 RepID=A0ABS6W514_9FLAO|nr:porin family protein [Mesonia aestuariivivens]MBW2962958.1 PorT family protein [Mesonia aestuariivivens]
MKKLVFVGLIMIFGLSTGLAQEVQFGAKAGINFATLSGDQTSDFETVTSFNVGVVSEISISEKFSFQPELMYSRQGYSFGDNVIALNYLNLPLMGKYYLTEGLSIEAGPQIGYLLSADNEGDDVEDSFNSFDFGVNFGVGYKLDNGLNFGVRYNLGISDVNELKEVKNTYKNDVFQVSVGYFF